MSGPHRWRARTVAGFLVLGTSIGMFGASVVFPQADLRTPAYVFLALAAYGLFGVSVSDILRIVGAMLGGAGAALRDVPPEERDDA